MGFAVKGSKFGGQGCIILVQGLGFEGKGFRAFGFRASVLVWRFVIKVFWGFGFRSFAVSRCKFIALHPWLLDD